MKKILLALMMISSFVFSADPIYWEPVGMVPTSLNTPFVNGTCYYDSLNDKYIVINRLIETTSSSRISADTLSTAGTKFFNGTLLWIVTNVGTVLYQGTYTSTQSYYAYNAYYPSQKYRAPECNNVSSPPICSSSEHLENNVCVSNDPICQLGTTLNATTHTCTIDFPITSTDYLEGGGVLLHYEDNKIMLLRRDGTAESWDLETGQYFFPNRAFEGVIPPSASYNPLSFNPSEPIQYKELTVGDFVAFEFNQMGIALKDASKFLTAPALLWTFGLSTKKETPDNIVLTQSSSISGTSISASTSNTPNIDFSEYENTATATPQTIPNTDIQVQKITTPPNPKDPNNWAGAGSTIKGYTGVATVGDVVATSPSNPNTAFIDTPTEVKIVQQKPDGSIDATIFNKQDLKNTATNETPLPVKEIKITPEKLANDGTYSQQQTTQQSTIVPSTNQNVATNLSTGLPDVVDFNPKTGVKDGNLYSTSTGLPVGTGTPAGLPGVAPITPAPAGGTGSIDLSGVTSRLEKLSNQLTKVNDALSQTQTPSATPNVENPIDNSKTDGILENFKTAWNTAKGDIDTLSSSISNAKDTVSAGFSLNLSTGNMETCPYMANLDFGSGHTYEIPIDFCKAVSPLKPILSIFFNILFQLMIITFSFKSFVRLV